MTVALPAASGIVLYGPPAVGKSTVTNELTKLDGRFQLFPITKAGPGRAAGYTMVSHQVFAAAASAGEFLVDWERYGSRYAVSAIELAIRLGEDQVPVVHLGSPAAVDAVIAVPAARWTVVELWADREVCAQRSRNRGTNDVEARLAAYDQTVHLGSDRAHLTIDTESTRPREAARAVRQVVLSWTGSRA